MKELKLLSLFLLLIIIESCYDDSVNPGENSDIFPLSVGNKWNYVQVKFDSESTPIDSNFYYKEIRDSVKDSLGNIWYENNFHEMLSKQYKGIWYQYNQSPNPEPAKLEYKYPTYTGDKYNNYEVVSVNKIVKIELGYFKTIQYRLNVNKNDLIYLDSYLAPDVGLVLENEVRNNSVGGKYISLQIKLISYNVK